MKVENGKYISNQAGVYLMRDVCAYCNENRSEDSKKKLADQIQIQENGSWGFCWPGVFIPGDWLAYRGAIPQAIMMQAVQILYVWFVFFIGIKTKVWEYSDNDFEILAWGWAIIIFLIAVAVYVVAMGRVSFLTYNWKMKRCFEKIGIAGREDVEWPELTEVLQREGKPSLVRAILFRVAIVLITACIFSVKYVITQCA